MRRVSPRRDRIAALAVAFIILGVPGVALAQASPFLTGATSLSDQHSRLADPGRDHPGDGARGHGDGKSARLGVVHWGHPRDRDRLRCAADRELGARHVRSVSDGGAQRRTHGGRAAFVAVTRPPMRWGRHFLRPHVQPRLHDGGIPPHEEPPGRFLIALPIHGICALLCARDARILRPDPALGGATAQDGRLLRELPPLEGEQL